jgi:hypothetical protein
MQIPVRMRIAANVAKLPELLLDKHPSDPTR